MERNPLGVCVVWFFSGLLVLMIFLPAISVRLGYFLLGDFAYLAFMPFCHQLMERSFDLFGAKLGVCARCLGIYLGIFLGLSFFLLSKKSPARLILIPIFFMLTDGLFNALGIIDSGNIIRMVLGLGFGISSGWLLGYGIMDLEQILGTEFKERWRIRNIT